MELRDSRGVVRWLTLEDPAVRLTAVRVRSHAESTAPGHSAANMLVGCHEPRKMARCDSCWLKADAARYSAKPFVAQRTAHLGPQLASGSLIQALGGTRLNADYFQIPRSCYRGSQYCRPRLADAESSAMILRHPEFAYC